MAGGTRSTSEAVAGASAIVGAVDGLLDPGLLDHEEEVALLIVTAPDEAATAAAAGTNKRKIDDEEEEKKARAASTKKPKAAAASVAVPQEKRVFDTFDELEEEEIDAARTPAKAMGDDEEYFDAMDMAVEEPNNKATHTPTTDSKSTTQQENRPMSVSQPTTTLSSDNWNESFRDIIANSGVPQHDLRALMSFCIEYIPTDDDDHHRLMATHYHYGVDDKKIDFIEGINLVVMYIKMGLIDLHEDFAEGFNLTYINYRTNDEGRITMLHVDPYEAGIFEMSHHWEEDNYVPYNLPKDILRFQSLEDLTLSSCRCIPDDVDLSSLPHLKKLGFTRREFGETSTSVPLGMNLPRLKELVVDNLGSNNDVPPEFGSWVTSQLPNLEILSFNRYGDGGSTVWEEPLLDALIANDNICFQDSLKQINFNWCYIAHNGVLERIIRSVLPKFAHMGTIEIYDGYTHFKFLSTLTATTPLPRTIHTFSLSLSADDEIRIMALKDPTEKRALVKFLEMNTSVYNVMSGDRKSNRQSLIHDYDPDIKYLLLINHAGKSVVVENGGSSTNRIYNQPSPIVPSSVLPILLARSYHQSGNIYHKRSPFRGTKDHTGMYYLLRHNITALTGTNQHNVTQTPTVSRNGIYDALTGMYYSLRHNIIALIGDASVTMDNRDANSKLVATRKRKRTQTEQVYTVSTTADGTMAMFPDGRTTHAVPQLPGFHGAATKEAFLETHLMNIYVEALLTTGCVRPSHKNIPNIFKYVQANFTTSNRFEHEKILNLLFHSWHDSGLSDYAKAGTSVLDTSVIAQLNTFITKNGGDE